MKYAAVIIATLCYVLPFYLALPSWVIWGWFVLGVVIGVALMMVDELVLYKLYVEKTPETLQLITRSPLFLAAYPLLAIFAITSTTNVLGIGVVLGLGLVLIVEGLILRNQPTAFHQRFFQHLPTEVDRSTILMLLAIEIAIFAVLSVFAWIRI